MVKRSGRRKGDVGGSFDSALDTVANRFLGKDLETGPIYYPEYARDPVGFFIDVLGVRPWKGEGEVPGQMEFLEGLPDNSHNLIFAGTGPGKTFMIGGIVCWFMATRRDAIVVTVATTWEQVVNQLWRQIRKMHKEAIRPMPGRVLTHSWEVGEKWFSLGLSPRNPETLAGYHADIEIAEEVKRNKERWREMTNDEYFATGLGVKVDRHAGGAVLFVCDEASGVPDELHDAGEGILTGPGCFSIISGNLTRTEGRFYELWKQNPTQPGNKLCFDGESPPPVQNFAPKVIEDSELTFTDPEKLLPPAKKVGEPEAKLEVAPVEDLEAIKAESKWRAFRWTAFDAPKAVINRPFIMRMRNECGKEYWKHPRYMVRVLAMPPLGSSMKVYPLGLLEANKDLVPRFGSRHMGVDLGFGGGDPCVATLGVGGRVSSIFEWNISGAVLDPLDIARVIFKLATGCTNPVEAMDNERKDRGWNVPPRNVHVDATGAGKAVVDILRRVFRFYVDGVVFSKSPTEEWVHILGPQPDLMDRRQELLYVTFRLMQEGLLAIPDRREYEGIWNDMTAIEFEGKGLDEWRVERKKAFVKREKRSSDHLDSVILLASRSDPSGMAFSTAQQKVSMRVQKRIEE